MSKVARVSLLSMHWILCAVFVYSFVEVTIDILVAKWYHYWYDLILFAAGAVYSAKAFNRLWRNKQ